MGCALPPLKYKMITPRSDILLSYLERLAELSSPCRPFPPAFYRFARLRSVTSTSCLNAWLFVKAYTFLGDKQMFRNCRDDVINDFANEKKLVSCFGLVPRVDQSNETINYGSIIKKAIAWPERLLFNAPS